MIHGQAYERWDQRAAVDYENSQAALAWSAESGESDLTCRFAIALWPIWARRGSVAQARRWIDAALPAADRLDRATRARLMDTAGSIALTQGEDERGRECLLAALAAYRALHDRRHKARMLELLAQLAVDRRQSGEATKLLEEAARIYREVGHKRGLGRVTNWLAIIAHEQGDYERAEALYNEALEIYGGVASVAFAPLLNLSHLSFDQGDVDEAAARALHALAAAVETRQPRHVAYAVGLCGRIAAARDQNEPAARLLAASDALLDEAGAVWELSEQEQHDRARASVAERLTKEDFAELWRAGSEMAADEAAAAALQLLQ